MIFAHTTSYNQVRVFQNGKSSNKPFASVCILGCNINLLYPQSALSQKKNVLNMYQFLFYCHAYFASFSYLEFYFTIFF